MQIEVKGSHEPSENHQHLAQVLRSRIKKDFAFCLFYLSPDLKNGKVFDLKTAAEKCGYSDVEALENKNELLKCGLWLKNADGHITLRDEFLNLGDLTALEHMTAAMNILGRLTEDGPCWYESFFVITNEEIKKEFYKSINQVIRTFIEKSQAVAGDRIVSWSHESLDCSSTVEKTNA